MIVETSCGKLEGTNEAGLDVFRGIPYAEPPERFRAPQHKQPWAGVRDASRFGAGAPQNPSLLGPMLGIEVGDASENCLFLNVWTPAADSGRRPVMVWIHGGAFVMGAGSQSMYDGAAMARRGDVVVVTINYRLGALGYLHLGELADGSELFADNLGLRDQVAALEWVQTEIAAFGGDPHNVTIFGESAGSISVANLLGTPSARGLFQRAILQSGAANFVSSRAQATKVAEAFCTALDIHPREIERLRDVPVAQLLDVQQRILVSWAGRVRGITYQPVIDGDILPRAPFESIAAGEARDISLIVGTNLDEMKLFSFMDPEARDLDLDRLRGRCEKRIPGADSHGRSHAARLITTYTEARQSRGEKTTAPELWFAIDSDRMFRVPAMHLAEAQARHQANTYAYLFTWPSPFMDGALGACHALELPFVFGSIGQPMLASFAGSGPPALRLSERMQESWVSFAHSGRPQSADLGAWRGYDGAARDTMIFGAECGIESAPREAERQVWNSIG